MERRLAAILAADVAGYSRLMGADEEGTLASLKSHRRELIDGKIAEHRGRIVKTTGDGILIEFPSVVDAARCGVEVQQGMAERNARVAPDRRIEFRVGINLGDVIVDGDDLYGDGVNIAARLEGIAEPNGICISRQVFEQIEGKLAASYRELGPQQLKNIAKPVDVYALAPLGVESATGTPGSAARPLQQEIKYCRASDGVRLAYATVGQGPPLVKTANWMNHLEFEWESPIWRHLFRTLASDRTLIRYDARGNGLSDWDVDEISFDRWVEDLGTVVDAAGVERFPLLGISQGCSVSIAYAARHPERVSHLILYGGFTVGRTKRAKTEAERQKFAAMATLMRLGWGAETSEFRQLFTSQFIPDGTKEQADWFNELQRRTTSPESAVRYYETVGNIDVTGELAKVAAPTLVMHVRGDAVVPIDAGREMAAGIPGARFVALQGKNHLFLEHEPAAARFFEEIRLFLAE
jgi:class 3 adenylate cyclase/pimeloyl-ACP methyl ester carboxylesterase